MYSQNLTFLRLGNFCCAAQVILLLSSCCAVSLKVNSCGKQRRGKELGTVVFLRPCFLEPSPSLAPNLSFFSHFPLSNQPPPLSWESWEMPKPRSWVEMQSAPAVLSLFDFLLHLLPTCQLVFLAMVCS